MLQTQTQFIKPHSTSQLFHLLHKITMSSAANFVDYYSVIGLESTASIREIRDAIREKTDFLLDSTTDQSVVYEQCLLLRKIEEILCDETRKSEYDAEYQVQMAPQGQLEAWGKHVRGRVPTKGGTVYKKSGKFMVFFIYL